MTGPRKAVPAFKAIVLLFSFSCVLVPLFASWHVRRQPGPTPHTSSTAPQLGQKRLASILSSLPASFEPNLGQSDPGVKFLSRGPGYALFLTPQEAVLSLPSPSEKSSRQSFTANSDPSRALRLRYLGANPLAQIEGLDLLPHRSNYLLGNEPSGQQPGVPNYRRVRYRSIYPGIDLVFHGDSSHLEFDLDVAPGADVRRARFRLDGADTVRLDASGDLIAKVGSNELRLHHPVAFQKIGIGETPVSAEFFISGNHEIRFRTGKFNPSLPLTIDPVLTYASFLGGSGADTAFAVALDPQHDFYVCGQTTSSNFPVSGGVQDTFGGAGDAFVLKLKSDGSGLAYSTFLGGNLADACQAIAVDSQGNAYVAGPTSSANFPTKNALQPALAGGQDIFVTKLSPDGASLVYSTYLGGGGLDTIAAIALDSSNNVVLAGTTKSADFPVVNALEPTLTGTAGNSDAFVAKLKADGSALIFSTYFGGSGVDGATGVAVSSTGNIWVAGGTGSTDFPVVNAIQSTFGGGGVSNVSPGDAFLAEFAPNGSSLLFSTYWGGSGQEQATSVSLDTSDNVFLVGITSSPNFPTHNALQPQLASAGGFNSFVTKFAADASSTLFSTYFGGTGTEQVFGSATDASGNIFIAGSTSSTNLPVMDPIQSSNLGGAADGFISQISANGSSLLFSTYMGGSGTDSFNRVAIDISGVYVVGSTGSSDFPTMGTLVNTFGGATDGVIVRLAGFAPAPDLALSKTHIGNLMAGTDGSYTLTVSNVGNGPTANPITVTDTLPAALTYASSSGTNWSCSAAAQTVTCTNPGPIAAGANSAITLNVHVTATAPPKSVTNTATVSVAGDPNLNNDSATDVAPISVAPVIAIAFGSATIGVNTSTSLTFTLTNPGGTDFTGVAFTDTLPAGLVVSTPNALTSTCGGTATATAASSSISLSGGTLVAGTICAVVVNVTPTNTGDFTDSVSVSSTNAGNGNTASSTLTVIKPFAVALAFNPSTILQTTNSTLTFTFTNPNPSFPLAFDTFTVALPAGLVFPQFASAVSPNTCQLHVPTEAQDGSSLTVTGSPLSGGASCTFSLSVNGPNLGTFTTSFSINESLAGPSNTATAALTVNKPAPFQVTSSFNPSTILQTTNSTLTLTFTNPNASLPLAFNTFTVALPAGLVFPETFSSVPPTTCQLSIPTQAVDGSSLTVTGPPLAGGASCTFSLAVNGPNLGTFTTSFSITSTLAGQSNTANATLTVNKPAPFRVASSFNPAAILQAGTSALTLTFTNPNASFPLAFNTFTVALPAGLVFPETFSSVPPTTCQLSIPTQAVDGSSLTVTGPPLAGGASCTFSLAVNGPNVGTFTTSFSITSALAGLSNTTSATLTVTANSAIASVSPSTLTFAAQLVGSSSASQTVTLKNTGNVSLAITNASASGDFSQSNNCGTSLAASTSCTFTIVFAPAAGGARNGSLAITDNASGSPQTVTLTGTGADFTVVPVSGSSLSATISRGQTASYSLNIAPTGGVAGSLSFACSGAPAESTCMVSPASTPTNGTASTSVGVSVTTTAPAAAAAPILLGIPGDFSPPTSLPLLRLLLCLSLTTVTALAIFVRKGNASWIPSRIWQQSTWRLAPAFRRGALAAALLALLTITFSSAGCANGTYGAKPDPGTPVGSYTLTVTATFTSGASTLKHNITLTMNVQ